MSIKLNCKLSRRPINSDRALSLIRDIPDLSKLEANLLASRGVGSPNPSLRTLVDTPMQDLSKGASRVSQAILNKELMVVVADYDCDGATSCSVVVAGLRALGANVEYVVPDRMIHGYGISPSVVDLALDEFPQARALITVDNGILGHSGISYAALKGLDVVVTDHHLPGETLPDAWAVINPARGDCDSGLNTLAGVSVALWLVLATKESLSALGRDTPSMNFLIPYVAIGTIADLVPLSAANRQLVTIGLQMIRQGRAPEGIKALVREAGLTPAYLTTTDIAFGLAPRINAAGRLETMHVGIDLLLSKSGREASKLAKTLTETNELRKKMQREASEQASFDVQLEGDVSGRYSIVQASSEWHPGIIGLVASKLKEDHYRPTFVFSLFDGEVKGSGRSIPGFHLKDALEEVARRAPGVLKYFGGHAMAAGAALEDSSRVEEFERVFEEVARERIDEGMLENILLSDGPVPEMGMREASQVLRHPWGQGFEAPAFDEEVEIKKVSTLGKDGKHWKVRVELAGKESDVVLFNQQEPKEGATSHLYLQPGFNTWRGKTQLQWIGRILN